MKKQKSTKRALLMSALSLLLCVSMLIGSTFAWFTDSVVSGNNIIKSGTLDVEMYWADGTEAVPAADSTAWTNAASGAIFNYDKWEPGYTEVRHIKIANVGSLALKYQLNILPNGEVSELADAIDVYYLDPAAPIAERGEIAEENKLGTLTEVLAGMSTTASGELLPNEGDTITIALKMQESAGNAYQGLSIGSSFSIQLLATQLTAEEDSFDDQYDVEATYLNKDADGAWLITNMDELFFLAADVNSGNSYYGETVKLTADIDLSGYEWIPIGSGSVNGQWIGFNGVFDGQDHTISNLKVTKGGGWNGLFGLVGRGTSRFTESISNLTVKNVTIEGSYRMTGAIVGQIYGNVENCHVENVNITVAPNWTGTEYDNGDKVGGIVGWLGDNGNNSCIKDCTATNVTLKAYRDVGGIVGYTGTTCNVENCKVDTISVTVDASQNYKGYTTPDEYDAEGVAGECNGAMINNTEINVKINAPQAVVSVATFADLKTMLTQLTDSGSGNNVINITADIKPGEGEVWEPVTVQGYTGAGVITVNGNGHTIYNLNAPLLAGGFAGKSGIIINDLTLANANIVDSENSQGIGAFIGCVDSMQKIELKNCHLKDSKIESTGGARVGGLVGWTAGYNNPNDGPVDTYVTITDCTVVNCEIIAAGSVGGIIGHAGANAATYQTISNCKVEKCTLISNDDSYRVGAVVGTANNGQLTISGCTSTENTMEQNNNGTIIARPDGQTDLFGRFVPSGTGVLIIDGVSY